MLIQDFVQVPCRFASVRAAMLQNPHALIDANAAAAYHEAEHLCRRVQPSIKHARFGNEVWVDIDKPYDRGDGMVLPIHWWAKDVTKLFPRLDGDLEIMPVGTAATELLFFGRYETPADDGSDHPDALLLHRLAQASLRSFLTRIGESVRMGDVLGRAS